MNLEEYADFVSEMASKDYLANFNSKLSGGSLGLAGESGEIAELTYDAINFNKCWSKSLRNKYISELSDVCWYIAFLTKQVLEKPLQELNWSLAVQLRKADQTSNLEVATLALVAKSAKVVELAKKVLYHEMPWDNVNVHFFMNVRLIYSIVHYFAENVVCVDFDDLILFNVNKLKERYKKGSFSTEEFLNKEKSCETNKTT